MVSVLQLSWIFSYLSHMAIAHLGHSFLHWTMRSVRHQTNHQISHPNPLLISPVKHGGIHFLPCTLPHHTFLP